MYFLHRDFFCACPDLDSIFAYFPRKKTVNNQSKCHFTYLTQVNKNYFSRGYYVTKKNHKRRRLLSRYKSFSSRRNSFYRQ